MCELGTMMMLMERLAEMLLELPSYIIERQANVTEGLFGGKHASQNRCRQGLHQTLVHRCKHRANDVHQMLRHEPIGGLVLVRTGTSKCAKMNYTRSAGLSAWLE